eukprot:419185_1
MSIYFVSTILIVLSICSIAHSKRITSSTEYPLYAIISQAKYNNQLTHSDLATISRFNAAQTNFNTTTSQTIHSYNSNFKLVHYHNSGHSQDIQQMEYNKSAIFQYPFGILTEDTPADSAANVLYIQLNNNFTSIPITASTVKQGNYSINCTDFISWIRIDNEYIKVSRIDNNTYNNNLYMLKVSRGIIGDGTSNPAISKHNSDSLIFAPVYNKQAPKHNNCVDAIRYEMNIESQFAVDILVNATYQDLQNGNDGSWYDLFAAGPFGAVDGMGNKLNSSQIWNQNANNYFVSCDQYIKAQQTRLTAIYNSLKSKYKYDPDNVTIFANNMNPNAYDNCSSGILLVADPPLFPYPLDGYCQEGYALGETGGCASPTIKYNTILSWIDHVNVLINASSLKLAAMPMIAAAGCKSTAIEILSAEMYKQVMMFGYGSFLIGVGDKNGNAMFGIPVMRQVNGKGNRYAYIDEMFSYAIGNPIEMKSMVDQYQIKGHISYQRMFEGGIVVVNPNNISDWNITLSKTYIDPTTNKSVNKLDMNPYVAYILLNK